MASQREKRLPAKIEGDKLHGDQRLRYALIEVLAAMNIGWTSDIVSTVGERFQDTCQDPVEPQYYSTCTANFPSVRSHCGGPEETLVEDEVQGSPQAS